MKRSRKCFLAALMFLVLALTSFLFSKETILGILRQKADERAADAYLSAMAETSHADTEKKTKDDIGTEDKNIAGSGTGESGKKTDPEERQEVSGTDKPSVPKGATEETLTDSGQKAAEQSDPPASDDALQRPIRQDRPEASPETTGPYEPSYVPILDDAYYERGGVVFTPEHAVGRIDCVLEIPKIGLKRCVYSGTNEEIDTDLDMWFTVSASGDLVPGETHYAIYGHNHTVQNLSFNRLGEVTVGDWFTLTRGGEVLIYLVTDVFAAERVAGRTAYAYDDSLDPSLCYIFTCGRDYMLLNGVSTRYKDFIVEGTLWRRVPLSKWQGTEDRGAFSGKTLLAAAGTVSFRTDAAKEESTTEEDLREALSRALEEVRAAKPAPVLTITSDGGSFSEENAWPAPAFSRSMALVVLTGVFAGISVFLFLASGLLALGEKHRKTAAP